LPAQQPDADQIDALPPIVVIAGEQQLTVASRDVEALNQFEELLQTLQRGRRLSFTNGNFSMFLLNNADATELAEVLNSLFSRDSRSSRSSYRSYSRRRSTNLTVVADERMNALLVYGSLADREVVEEMLDVLDSADIPDSLTSERPSMIPVKNLPAATVLNVLESVYRSQLSARRGLRPVTIPVGISAEMTSMLELINATANSPILTLDVDETTNSIVMRAPRQLGEEIEEFVQELDEQAEGGGKRTMSLVPLKGMNSEQMEDALQLLMRGGRYRRSSSSYRSR
jgi:type II secretory pathway component GspD/PulD (secretin)